MKWWEKEGKVYAELCALKRHSEWGSAACRLLSLNQRGGKLNVAPSFISSPGTAGCEAACLNIYTQMQRRAHRNSSARCQPSINRKKTFQFLTRSTFSTPSHCGTLADQVLFFLFALHVSARYRLLCMWSNTPARHAGIISHGKDVADTLPFILFQQLEAQRKERERWDKGMREREWKREKERERECFKKQM